MNPVFATRRRAEELHASIEGASTDELRDARDADLLAVISTLRTTPRIEARPAFVSDLRERLMIAAETALTPDTSSQAAARRAPAPRRTARERRIAVAVGGFAVVSATASMAVAAQTALPGDPLYPLKRAIENAHTSVQTDPESKGSALLDSASGRLDEVDALSRDTGADDAQISATLHDFATQATAASELLITDYTANGDEASIEELRSFTTSSMETLTGLQGLVPVDSRASLIEAARILGAIDLEALNLCPVCSDEPVTLAPSAARRSLDDLLSIVSPPAREPVEAAPPRPDSPTPDKPVRSTDPDPQLDEQPGVRDDATEPADEPDAPATPVADPEPDNPIKDLSEGLGGLKDGARNATDGGLRGLLGGLSGTLSGLGGPKLP